MKPGYGAIVAVMAALSVSGSAQAQSDEAPSLDARCFALGGALSKNADPKAQQAGAFIMNFFMGRISALGKPVDLDKAVAAAREETKGGIGPLATQCEAVQKAAGALLIAAPPPAAAAQPPKAP